MGSRHPDPVPGCTSCGACCFSTDHQYIQLWAVDLARLSSEQRAKLLWLDVSNTTQPRYFLNFYGGHCAALVIDPDARTFHCAVYEARPDACRALAPGSRHCRDDIREKAERPLLAVADLLRKRRAQTSTP